MVRQQTALDLLVANFTVHFHGLACLGALPSTAPWHATVDGVQGFYPIGLSLAQLGSVVLVFL
jgi:hypothetical protein